MVKIDKLQKFGVGGFSLYTKNRKAEKEERERIAQRAVEIYRMNLKQRILDAESQSLSLEILNKGL